MTTGPGPIIILGMHRSGTSCLAGSLERAGLYLGEVERESPYNRNGNHENLEIRYLHKAVLADNNSSWDAPPKHPVWRPELKNRRDRIITSFPSRRAWGFKDPRTVLLLDEWLAKFPSAKCVATFRHPDAVAKSLHSRNKFPREKCLDLWLEYNTRLLRYQDALGFALVCFDWSPELYLERLDQIGRGLGLAGSVRNNPFFDTSLRRNKKCPGQDLPAPVADLHAQLLEKARGCLS